MRVLVRRIAYGIAVVVLALAASVSEAQRVAWTTTLNASLRNPMAMHPLASDGSGNVFVVFNVFNGTTSEITTIKLLPNGAEAWRATYSSINNAYANAIATDDAGNVIVAATAVPPGAPAPVGAGDYLTVKYDAAGHELWRRTANVSPPGNALPFAIATDGAGNVYVTGGSNYNFNNADGDFFTLKYAPDGTELWRAVTDGGYKLLDFARAITPDVSGNVYLAGTSVYHVDNAGSFSAGAVLKYDSAGKLQWQHQMGGVATGGVGVAVDNAGNAYLATQSSSYPLGVPFAQLAKFDVQGKMLWSVYPTDPNTPLFGDCSGANALALDRSGNAYFTGFYCVNLLINSRYTYFTMKYDASGAEQWRTIDIANLSPYGNRGNFAVGLVVNANDDVIVTGQRAYLGPGTTMKLGVGGQEIWSVEQPVFTPTAIARGPANSIYVVGTTATGIVVQMIVDDPAVASTAAVPATGSGALLLLALALMVLTARRIPGPANS